MKEIVPTDDWIEHSVGSDCVCEPEVIFEDGEILIIHNAIDGREVPFELVSETNPFNG